MSRIWKLQLRSGALMRKMIWNRFSAPGFGKMEPLHKGDFPHSPIPRAPCQAYLSDTRQRTPLKHRGYSDEGNSSLHAGLLKFPLFQAPDSHRCQDTSVQDAHSRGKGGIFQGKMQSPGKDSCNI